MAAPMTDIALQAAFMKAREPLCMGPSTHFVWFTIPVTPETTPGDVVARIRKEKERMEQKHLGRVFIMIGPVTATKVCYWLQRVQPRGAM